MEIGLVLFLALFILLYLIPNNFILQHFKGSLFFPLLFLSFIICLIFFTAQSFKAAQFGFNLWLNVVFPSLLPFFIAAELLNGTGLVRAVGVLLEPVMRPIFNVPGVGSFAFAMGISSGYPVGAKITTNLREAKLCTKTEAERLLAFSNNSSPLFITGAVATGIFGRPDMGIMLLCTHCAACITVGLLFRFYKSHERKAGVKTNGLIFKALDELANSPSISFGNIGMKLGDAIKNSINTLLMIGGFIVLFSVIINMLINLNVVYFASLGVKYIFQHVGMAFSMAPPLVTGIFEITMGAKYLSLSFAPLYQKLIIAAFVLGWGGLSVHSQVASIVSRTDISMKPYLVGKFLQGIFAAIYTGIYINKSGVLKNQTAPVFDYITGTANIDWLTYFKLSSEIAGVIFILLLLLMVFCYLLKHYISSSSPRKI